MEEGNIFVAVILAVVLMAGSFFVGTTFSDTEVEVVYVDKEVVVKEYVQSNDSFDSIKLDYLYSNNLNVIKDIKEAKSLELSMELYNDEDFLDDLMDFLNSEGQDVKEVEDIESVVIRESDVDVSGLSGVVELELKVYFFNDGDYDEEDKEKVRLYAYFDVSELDEDDDYEDSEAEFDEFELIKFND